MNIPFTSQQFLEVFEKYNLSVWPFQIILFILSIITILLSFSDNRHSGKIISCLLSFIWIWMGIVYHLIYFTAINSGAYIFGAAFILQGAFFLYYGFIDQRISIRFKYNIFGLTGIIFIFFALILYPLLGFLLGHKYPASPTFGLPCPTTIFTLGILLWTDKKIPVLLIVIPVAWSLIGFTAAFSLGIKEDTGLLISGLVFVFLLVYKNRINKLEIADWDQFRNR